MDVAIVFAGLPAGLLAQRAGEVARSMAGVLVWCVVLVGAAVLLGTVFYIIRKRLMAEDESDEIGLTTGFTLADLRVLHARGELSDEEFEFAKRKLKAAVLAEPSARDASAATSEEDAVNDLGDLSADFAGGSADNATDLDAENGLADKNPEEGGPGGDRPPRH